MRGKIVVLALLNDAKVHGQTLVLGQSVKRLHYLGAAAQQLLDPLKLIVAPRQRLHAERRSRSVLDAPPVQGIGQNMSRNPKQPGLRGSCLGPVFRPRTERTGERLGRQVRSPIGSPGRTKEVAQDGSLESVVEDPERIRVAHRRLQKLGIAWFSATHYLISLYSDYRPKL